MQPHEFSFQMKRLKSTFGENPYPQERVDMIWKFVQYKPIEWFIKSCDFFISESRQAPLLGQFRDNYFAEYRDTYNKDKSDEQKIMVPEWKRKKNIEYIRQIQQKLALKIAGKITGFEFKTWLKIFEATIKAESLQLPADYCSHCDDTGAVLWRNESELLMMSRCTCRAGKKNYPSKKFNDYVPQRTTLTT